jgi:hypothetical protein
MPAKRLATACKKASRFATSNVTPALHLAAVLIRRRQFFGRRVGESRCANLPGCSIVVSVAWRARDREEKNPFFFLQRASERSKGVSYSLFCYPSARPVKTGRASFRRLIHLWLPLFRRDKRLRSSVMKSQRPLIPLSSIARQSFHRAHQGGRTSSRMDFHNLFISNA